ncbi:MAG: hypothetical protein GY803_30805 [Chloroflexi bacterium]|nr:hypothetical protein [Chloroflexota bacterium]
MGGFSIPPAVWWGAGAIALAFGLLFVVAKALAGGRMLRVPDGVPVDRYYRQWKRAALSRRIGRLPIFLACLGVSLFLGGCGAVLVGFLS